MEFTKDINFSDNLKERKTATITYSGSLFQNGSESVTMVYGFGDNWDYTTEQEMKKTEAGFTADVEMKENYRKFNFCFRNSNFVWDNNNNCNYISEIEECSLEELLEPKQEIDESLIIELLDSLLNETANFAAEEPAKEEKQQILDDILTNQENNESTDFIQTENFDMDQLVENILNPVINCETSEDAINECTEESTSYFVEDTIPEPESSNEKYSRAAQFFSESTVIEEETKAATVQEEPSLLETEVDTSNSAENIASETTTSEDKFLISPRQLSRFYLIKKKIKLAFYKLFVAIPKILTGETDNSKD